MANKEQKIMEFINKTLDDWRYIRKWANELNKPEIVLQATAVIQELYHIKEILEDDYNV